MYPVEAVTNFDAAATWSHEHVTLISKQFHASTGRYISKSFIRYPTHRHKIHEQSIFPRFFIFAFNSAIDSLYLTDWGKLFQSKHALNNTEFMLQEVDSAEGNLIKGPFLILYFMFLKTKYDHRNSGFRLFKDLKIHIIKHVSVFDGLKIHYYPEEVHRSFCYCYIPPLVFCGESFESLNIVSFCKTSTPMGHN